MAVWKRSLSGNLTDGIKEQIVDFLEYDEIKSNLDSFFLVIMGMVVYFMQCGFAFLEAGAVRSKNSTNILVKNVLDSFISGIAYWVLGYAFAFGVPSNVFLGYGNFASHDLPESEYAFFFFQYVFAATAATIVSGALAERCQFVAYLIYSFLLSAFIYPVVTHWAWTDSGWLSAGGEYLDVDGSTTFLAKYQDFAGSGVVHVVGGTAAAVGAALLGPRLGRFSGDGKVNQIRGHSVPLAALGGFILFFGFLAFNGGSQLSISAPGDGNAVAVAIKNTVIAGSCSALCSLILSRMFGNSRWSLLQTINGALTGMVAICAGCNVFHTWTSAVVGVVASIVFRLWSVMLLALKLDDPLDAVAVHLGGGLWGVIAVPIFQKTTGIIFTGSRQAFVGLAWQFCGLASILVWVGVCSLLLFGLLHVLGLLRVTEEVELQGIDLPKHGEPAYPLEAYGSEWLGICQKLYSETRENPDGKQCQSYEYENDAFAMDSEMQNDYEYEKPEPANDKNNGCGYVYPILNGNGCTDTDLIKEITAL